MHFEQFLTMLAKSKFLLNFRLKVSLTILIPKCLLSMNGWKVSYRRRVLEDLRDISVLAKILDSSQVVCRRAILPMRSPVMAFVTRIEKKESAAHGMRVSPQPSEVTVVIIIDLLAFKPTFPFSFLVLFSEVRCRVDHLANVVGAVQADVLGLFDLEHGVHSS